MDGMLDGARRVAVTAAAAGCLVALLFGSGLLGTAVERSAGGALSATATLLAPAGPAFAIWSVIYLGLVGAVVWQWRSADERTRSTAPWVAGSLVLNGAWLLVVQLGWLWASVVVIIALLVDLIMLVRRLERTPPSGWPERILVDGTFGLYLGWVAVATCANVAAVLVAAGGRPDGLLSQGLAVLVLVVVAAIAMIIGLRLRNRWPIVVAMSWGLAWIALGRSTAQPESVVVAAAAAVAAVVGLAAAALGQRSARAAA